VVVDKNKAEKILNILFAVIAVSCALRLMLPGVNFSGLSPFTVIGGLAAVALVAHIFLHVGPANRRARDRRSGRPVE
jgi:hypothetical protein